MHQVIGWLQAVLLRPPGHIPAPLRPVWWLLVLTVAIAAILLFRYGPLAVPAWMPLPPWVVTLAVGLVLSAASGFLLSHLGDAARYLHGAPANVDLRQRIRTKGVELLKKLADSDEYERIIVVGHSLGSVIGYEIVTYLWALPENRPDPGAARVQTEALKRLVALSRAEPFDADAYRAAQEAYLDELRANGSKWRISDLVTLGSPLTYGEWLLASSPADFAERKAARELPTCPPVLEGKGDKRSFAYPPERPRRRAASIPHHAACFAPTRWTNLYFPAHWLMRGDPIGGPLARLFGAGIRDVPVSTPLRRGFFAHTCYWSLAKADAETPAVAELRRALLLAGGAARGPKPAAPQNAGTNAG
jgi:hypothetical protein